MTTFEFDSNSTSPLKRETVYEVGTTPPLAVKGLGGSAVTINATDAYTSLDKSTIDGTMTMAPSFLDAYKLLRL
jgi:hypothetical protein